MYTMLAAIEGSDCHGTDTDGAGLLWNRRFQGGLCPVVRRCRFFSAMLKARTARLEALHSTPAPPPEATAQTKTPAGETRTGRSFPPGRRSVSSALSATSVRGEAGICAASAGRPFNTKTNDRTRQSDCSAVYLFCRLGQAMENPSGRGGYP